MSNKSVQGTLAAIALTSATLMAPQAHAQSQAIDPFAPSAAQNVPPVYERAQPNYGRQAQQGYATRGQPIQVDNLVPLDAGGVGQFFWLPQYDVITRNLAGQRQVYNFRTKGGGWEDMNLIDNQFDFGKYRARHDDYTVGANPQLGKLMSQVGYANQKVFLAELTRQRNDILDGVRNYQRSFGNSSLPISDSWPPSLQITIIPTHAVVNGGPNPPGRQCYDGRGLPTPCAQ